MTLLGLGTYRSRDAAHSARIAAAAGCPLIDTAPVYGHGTHQSAIASTLEAHPQVRIASKVGHMTPGHAEVAVSSGALATEEARGLHSIAADYVRHQIAMNRLELRRPRLDLVFLHNPDHHHDGDRDGLHDRIRGGFIALEEARAEGLITGYGVATWSGFTEAFSVPDLLRLSREASGSPETGLAAVQLPVSLVNIAPIKDALTGSGPLAEAHEAGLEVWASAPLHGGKLVHLVNERLAHHISDGASPAEAALMVTASAPGLTGMLISASSAGHWLSAASVAGRPPLPENRLKDISDLLLSRENA
ncbi:aldo/keto reductase [Nocardiopsis sp. NRRL B-16309]|uniref:aldo/keto reductase n=1 Tax=Nocardiopsis sp. NRRL B-16309 TaxID=1519494 RepID=UPI0006ADBEA6|nr:aldo/keto reductase [Nocardiopsis sp. NRRL B-16309]